MGDAASADDRLPWLDAPRSAKPIPAARRARTPLLVLLGLFLVSAIAVMAYLAGRGAALLAPAPPVERSALPTALPPAQGPALVPPAPPPVPVATANAPPATQAPRAMTAKPRATRPQAKREAKVRRSSTGEPARRTARAAVAHRNTDRARALPQRYAAPHRGTVWPARPFAGPRGRVIQLGAYRTQAQADAAWWRVARAYPYLSTLPRVVTATGPSRGRPLYYRVRLAAGSGREARALCSNLRRIGRGCRRV